MSRNDGPVETGGTQGQSEPEPTDLEKGLVRTDDTIKRFTVVSALAGVASAAAAIVATVVAVYTATQLGGTSKQTERAIGTIANVVAAQQDQVNGIANETVALDNEANAMVNEAQQTALEVGALSNSAGAAQGQLVVMQDAQRPIVSVAAQAAGSGMHLDEKGGVSLNMEITVKNSGHDAMEYAYPFGEFYISTFDPTGRNQVPTRVEMRARQEAFCKRVKARPTNNQMAGLPVAPGDQTPIDREFSMTAADLDTWRQALAHGRWAASMLIGCVDYMYKRHHHQTTFAFEIDKLRSGPNPFELVNPTELPLQPAQIAVGLNPTLGGQSN